MSKCLPTNTIAKSELIPNLPFPMLNPGIECPFHGKLLVPNNKLELLKNTTFFCSANQCSNLLSRNIQNFWDIPISLTWLGPAIPVK